MITKIKTLKDVKTLLEAIKETGRNNFGIVTNIIEADREPIIKENIFSFIDNTLGQEGITNIIYSNNNFYLASHGQGWEDVREETTEEFLISYLWKARKGINETIAKEIETY